MKRIIKIIMIFILVGAIVLFISYFTSTARPSFTIDYSDDSLTLSTYTRSTKKDFYKWTVDLPESIELTHSSGELMNYSLGFDQSHYNYNIHLTENNNSQSFIFYIALSEGKNEELKEVKGYKFIVDNHKIVRMEEYESDNIKDEYKKYASNRDKVKELC